jgi:hypothetical protein
MHRIAGRQMLLGIAHGDEWLGQQAIVSSGFGGRPWLRLEPGTASQEQQWQQAAKEETSHLVIHSHDQ